MTDLPEDWAIEEALISHDAEWDIALSTVKTNQGNHSGILDHARMIEKYEPNRKPDDTDVADARRLYAIVRPGSIRSIMGGHCDRDTVFKDFLAEYKAIKAKRA